MIILVDGINKNEVYEKAMELNELLGLDVMNGENFTFEDWLLLVKDHKNMIVYNAIVTNQAICALNKTTPIMTNNEIIAATSLMLGNSILIYCVSDDIDYLYSKNEEGITEEEFKEKLKAYNMTAVSMKTLMPVVPKCNKLA